jgi:hypothetical protein
MKSDAALHGATLISISIILSGIVIGAQIFSIAIPFAPYIMVGLAVLVVIGALLLLSSCRDPDGSADGR